MDTDIRDELILDGIPLQRFLTYRIVRLHSKLNAQALRLLRREGGLTITQWRVLSLTGSLGGETTFTEIVSGSQMDKGQLSRGIKDLLKQGLIAARSNDKDQRQQHLMLTPRGKEIYARMLPKMRQRHQHLLAGLSETERSMIYEIFDKLEVAADEDPFA